MDHNENLAEFELRPLQQSTDLLWPDAQALGSYESVDKDPGAPRQRKRTISRFLFDIFCLVWIVPIAYSLFLNFSNWIVGAGVGCRAVSPQEHCFPDILGVLGQDRHQNAASLNRQDRDILGALQLVAKALETWFAVVATSIIFDLAMWLAASEHGLPLNYLFAHVSFPDLLMLFESALWTSSKGAGRRNLKARLVWFVALIVFLCVACNLMGPAVAVLIIPQLGWSEIYPPTVERFGQIAASKPPETASVEFGCSLGPLPPNKTCLGVYSMSLDELSSGWKLRLEWFNYGWSPLNVVSEHDGILFTFNSTSNAIVWAPSRQVLRHMAYDYTEVFVSQGSLDPQNATEFLNLIDRREDPTLYDRYRNALDVVLHRKGPSVGIFQPFCSRATVFEQMVSATKSVRCYNILRDDMQQIACFRVGSGWGEVGLAHSRFSIRDTDTIWPTNVSVDVYAVTKTVLVYNGDLGKLGCGDSANTPCDWDHLFSLSGGQYSNMEILASPLQVVEYSMPRPSGLNITVYCENVVYLAFPDYVIDVSLDQNSIGLAQLETSNDTNRGPIYLHPDWIVTAWSVTPSGEVEATRAAAVNLVSALKSTVEPPELPDLRMLAFSNQHAISTLHALTLINFDTINATDASPDDPDHPLLTVSKSLRVWAYGSQTRTFRFAAAVSIFGCLVALLRPVMSLTIATRRPSTLRLVVAALRSQDLGRLDSIRSERELGRVPLKIIHHHGDEQIVLLHRDNGLVAPAVSPW